MSSNPLDYQQTKELMEIGQDTRGDAPSPNHISLSEVAATIVCNDTRSTFIKADAQQWGYMEIGAFVSEGVWSYNDDDTKEDVLIPYTTIHHIQFHFTSEQAGTDTND